MGNGYGSEFHLLRYLGYHRHSLNQAVEKETGGQVSDWLDFAFDGAGKPDREWKGVDFVDPASDVKSAWAKFWPQTGNSPNWDAVGLLETDSGPECLLVEAKAHLDELQSSCSASEKGGLEMIRKALDATIKANGFTAKVEKWLKPYYQYANRVAHLHFLLQQNVPTRLVFIYFCGDKWLGNTLSSGKPPKCPKEAMEWVSHVKDIHDCLGLSGKSKLEERIHSVFLPVCN